MKKLPQDEITIAKKLKNLVKKKLKSLKDQEKD